MTRAQLAALTRAAEIVRARFPNILCHAAASAGVLGYPDAALDLVRVGIALYGVTPAPHLSAPLRPVMTLMSRVFQTRRVAAGAPVSYGATYRPQRATTIATIPVGYADGYPRALTNAGTMLIGRQRHPVAGRVCMDFTMLDVDDAAVREGDDVTVFGPGLSATEVAAAAGTISYELFCRVGRRVPRLYVRAGRIVAIAMAGGDLRSVDADRPGIGVR
jgi:alanine racemase